MKSLEDLAKSYFPESEERAARCLDALREERKRLLKWCKEKILGHRNIALEKEDAGDSEMASTHIAIETAYVGIVRELEESE